MITWTEDMETGLDAIDYQHRRLIEKFNELEEAIHENRGRTETQKILEFVQFYADWHFKHEEKCMDDYQCPLAQSNKDQHAFFLKRFSSLHYQYYNTNADPKVVRETLNELSQWIENHILQVDVGLKPCAAKRIANKQLTKSS